MDWTYNPSWTKQCWICIPLIAQTLLPVHSFEKVQSILHPCYPISYFLDSQTLALLIPSIPSSLERQWFQSYCHIPQIARSNEITRVTLVDSTVRKHFDASDILSGRVQSNNNRCHHAAFLRPSFVFQLFLHLDFFLLAPSLIVTFWFPK